MRLRYSISLLVVAFTLAAAAFAQSTDNRSLGDVARENNATKADGPHAKKIYTNEDLNGTAHNDQAESASTETKTSADSNAPATDSAQATATESTSSTEKPAAQASSQDGPPAAGRRGPLTGGARKRKKKDNTQTDASANPKGESGPLPQNQQQKAKTQAPPAPSAPPAEKPAQAKDQKKETEKPVQAQAPKEISKPATAQPQNKEVAKPAEAKIESKPVEKPVEAKAEKKEKEGPASTEANDGETKAAAAPVPLPPPLPTPPATQPAIPAPPALEQANGQPTQITPLRKKGTDDERDPTLPPPLTADATLTAGFYEADTKNGHVSRESSPVGSVNFDINGYFHHPDFLKFNFKPQGSLGKQSSEAVFPDGRGLSVSSTFLGGGVAPLTVSYSKLDRHLVTFGPLDRLAGLDANTSQDALNLNWRIRLRRLPELTMNFSRFNDSYEPLQDLAPKTDNHARLFTLGAQQKIAGWNLESDFRVERANQKLINLFDPTQAPYDYGRNDRELRASADRDFGHKFLVNVNGGASKGDSSINGTPYDQSFKFATGSGVYRPTERLSLAFRGGITDNVVGVTLANTLNSTSSQTPQTIALLPTQAHITLQNYGAQATYSLTKDLRLDGDVSRQTTSTPTSNSLVSPDSSLNSLQAGLGYSHNFSWLRFQSRYAANGGTFDYGTNGTSRSLGHRANVDFTFGSLHSVELTLTGQGSLQDLNGPTTMHDQTWGAGVSVSRMFFQNWKVQATANLDKNAYRYSLADYDTLGKGGSFSITNPRFDLTAMYQLRDGLTVQADPRLQFLPATQLIALQGAFPTSLIVPTASSFTTATFAAHPVPKFTARATWMTSRQAVADASHNRYNQWEFSAGYQFRSVNLDFGYIHHDQDFGVDFFRRNRVYFRIVRQFKVF